MISRKVSLSKKDFRIQGMSAHTLSWWRMRRNQIDMDPPYQRRGKLWSATDKAYLIDSILNEYDIPKFYLADFTWGTSPLNKKKLPYAIIDGKQRFEAIFDFYDGQIVLDENFVFLQNPDLELGGLSYKDITALHPQISETFDQYNLAVMSVVARSEEPINELFVRLNRSKPLTGAEIRNAMSGPVPNLTRLIAQHEFFTVNAHFTMKRAQDRNAAAKLLYFEYSDRLRETKKRHLDEFTHAASLEKKKIELAARRVLDVLDEMQEIFLPKDPLLSSAGQVPVYYWFVRSRKESDYPIVREFLVKFEAERRNNRMVVTDNPTDKRIEKQFVEYDQFNRNTNDLASHEGRIRILEREFKKFSKTAAARRTRSGQFFLTPPGSRLK